MTVLILAAQLTETLLFSVIAYGIINSDCSGKKCSERMYN
jgi:hypothetical protein